MTNTQQYTVVVPAAGVGKRMQIDKPKQYLLINNKTIIEHTIERLLSHPLIKQVVVSLSAEDDYFANLPIAGNAQVETVIGGKERYDSVLAGLRMVKEQQWVLVHDAARPCVTHTDIEQLIQHCVQSQQGAILATPVRDTMKRTDPQGHIHHTENRDNLWHAQTPQMFAAKALISALEQGINTGQNITDEASAMELIGKPCDVVSGREDNIKITRPSDVTLASFILTQQKEEACA